MKKISALMLIVMVCLSMFSISVFAEDSIVDDSACAITAEAAILEDGEVYDEATDEIVAEDEELVDAVVEGDEEFEIAEDAVVDDSVCMITEEAAFLG